MVRADIVVAHTNNDAQARRNGFFIQLAFVTNRAESSPHFASAWGIYPSVFLRFMGIASSMSYQTQELLKAVRVEGEGWEGAAREQLESGRNFFLIVPDGQEGVARFCQSFGLQSDCLKLGNFNR